MSVKILTKVFGSVWGTVSVMDDPIDSHSD